MNAVLFLAMATVVAHEPGLANNHASLPYVVVPGVFEAMFGWHYPDAGADPETGDMTAIRETTLAGTLLLHERLDRKRLVFRVNGVDMKDYLLSPATTDPGSRFRRVRFEIPNGRAFVEFEVYAVGAAQPVYRERKHFDIPRPPVMEAGEIQGNIQELEKRSFQRDDIPAGMRRFAPPEYREQQGLLQR